MDTQRISFTEAELSALTHAVSEYSEGLADNELGTTEAEREALSEAGWKVLRARRKLRRRAAA